MRGQVMTVPTFEDLFTAYFRRKSDTFSDLPAANGTT
jgi:hypothetical protein